MGILNLNNENEVKRYKEFLEKSEYTRFPQELEWINVKRNWIPEVVYVEKDDEILAGVLILIKKVGPFSIMYAQSGPVMDIKDKELLDLLVKEVDKIAKKYNAIKFIMSPDIKAEKDLRDKLVKDGYKVTPLENHKVFELLNPVYTFVLDIENKTEEELLKSFNSKARYNIRLSNRKGVKVEYGTSEEFVKRFYELHSITCKRSKIAIREFEYYLNLVESFGQKARVYIASHEGDDIFAAICISSGVETYYVYGASSNKKRNLMASENTMFEMIKWGLENNCKYYNFGGFTYLDENNGLYKFKIKFTGEEGLVRKIGQVEKVYKPFIDFAFNKLLNLRMRIINLLNGSGLK